MATVIKIQLTSHWINYNEEDLKKIIENAIKKDNQLKKHQNEITIEVVERT